MDVQDVADHIGDSLFLAMKARNSVKAKNIIFCAVSFMSETAAILNPTRNVYTPSLDAECPMAAQINPSMIQKARGKYPGLPIVVYVNTTAETKAYADVCCTSANALEVVNAIAKEWGVNSVVLAPDANLAANTDKKTDINVIGYPEKGCCPIHNIYSVEDVNRAKRDHPNATIIVHPETPSAVASMSDYMGSTAQLLTYIEKHDSIKEYVIGTENEFIKMVSRKFPDKSFWTLNEKAYCPSMKKVTLESILKILEAIDANDSDYLTKMKAVVEPEIITKATKAIEKMIQLTKP